MAAHEANGARIRELAGGPVDVGIVLGSGLSGALAQTAQFRRIPYARLESIPVAPLAGHAGEVLAGIVGGKRVVAFAGRVHCYQGFDARDVTFNVEIAHAAGARTMILTNAAGGLNEAFVPGDLMLIADHINLSGRNPLVACDLENPFVDMLHAYSPELREAAKRVSKRTLREGVYACVLGPSYETPAEARFLRTIGADAVGMSTAAETIVARSKSMDVLGISLITNVVGKTEVSHSEVTAAGNAAAEEIAALISGVIAGL
jgi:purine-nucleoside phosphorylase